MSSEVGRNVRTEQTWSTFRQEKNYHLRDHQHIARYVRPAIASYFDGNEQANRAPAIEKLWDDTAVKANEQFARGMITMTANAATDWVKVGHSNKAIDQIGEVRDWYTGKVLPDLKKQFLGGSMYAALLLAYQDGGAFGFGFLYSYVADKTATDMAYEWVAAPECYYELDREGRTRRFIRPLSLTAFQASNRFGKEMLGPNAHARLERNDHSTKSIYLHCVFPKDDTAAKEAAPQVPDKFKFRGYYYDMENRRVLDPHGFDEMPYHGILLNPNPSSPYPLGIGYSTLPEIRNVNAMRRQYHMLIDREADPAILGPDVDESFPRRTRPSAGEMVYNGVTEEGRPRYLPLHDRANNRSLAAEIKDSQEMIREAWYWNLMLLTRDVQMTATEVESRDEKLVQAMGPFIIPLRPALVSVVERTFVARIEAGKYDPLPEALADDPDGALEVDFNGILAKAQQKIMSGGIMRTYTKAGVIAELKGDTSMLDVLDDDGAVRHIAQGEGIPDDMILSPERVQEKRDERAQQDAAMAAAAAAPGLAKAAKDGADAMKTLEGEGNAAGTGLNLAP